MQEYEADYKVSIRKVGEWSARRKFEDFGEDYYYYGLCYILSPLEYIHELYATLWWCDHHAWLILTTADHALFRRCQ